MPLNIVRDDLCNMRADAIVLPANERLEIDGGAGGAIARKAGRWRLQRACRKIGRCSTGHAVATRAFSFPARYLIHAVGPLWQGEPDDLKLLRSAYREALDLAICLGCSSVALPLLSSGVRNCPAHVSLSVALDIIEETLEKHDLQVTLVLFDRQSVAAGLDFLGDLERRIDDATATYIRESTNTYYAAPPMPPGAGAPASASARPSAQWDHDQRRESAFQEDDFEIRASEDADYSAFSSGFDTFDIVQDITPDELMHEEIGFYGAAKARPCETGSFDFSEAARSGAAPSTSPSAAFPAAASLENRLGNLEAGFSQTLLQLIDESGLTDAQVYRRANMSRQHFSKIRSNAGYRPSKATVLSLCIALRLDLDRTRDLLSRAGFALTHANKFDIIVEYFIERGEYDQFKINETLFYFDQPLLGG